MNIPGFTAAGPIGNAGGHYSMATVHDLQIASTSVEPALPRVCDWLSERVWGAYNEGAYNRGEFWLNVMERAGCFR
jgi:hypothetical protein